MTAQKYDPHWACLRCLRNADHHWRLHICYGCRDKLHAAGLRWCNHCDRAVTVAEYANSTKRCKACHNAHQRRYSAERPDYRAGRVAYNRAWRERNRERYREHIRAWRKAHPEQARRRNAERANARRRERYQADAAYRERRKASARAYWPIRRYKWRIVGRPSRAKERP